MRFEQQVPDDNWTLLTSHEEGRVQGSLKYQNLDTGEIIQVPNVWYNQPDEWRIEVAKWRAEQARELAARIRKNQIGKCWREDAEACDKRAALYDASVLNLLRKSVTAT